MLNSQFEDVYPRYSGVGCADGRLPHFSKQRQLSPQVAAALLAKLPAELTSRRAQIVDTLKRKCPGFAVMRKLVFGFRDSARRQGDHPAPLDGAGAQHRYPFTGVLCADFETGPKRS